MAYLFEISEARRWLTKLLNALNDQNSKADQVIRVWKDLDQERVTEKEERKLKSGKHRSPARYTLTVYDETLYPPLPHSSEFSESGMLKYIDEESGFIINDQELITKAIKGNGLAQLLYLVVWKNGMLDRFRHIRRGLIEKTISDSDIDGVVFNQFARHVMDRDQPIVDKHSIRAFAFLEYESKQKKALNPSVQKERLRDIQEIDSVDIDLCKNYTRWFKGAISKRSNPLKRAEALRALDKTMFSIGKMLGTKKRVGRKLK